MFPDRLHHEVLYREYLVDSARIELASDTLSSSFSPCSRILFSGDPLRLVPQNEASDGTPPPRLSYGPGRRPSGLRSPVLCCLLLPGDPEDETPEGLRESVRALEIRYREVGTWDRCFCMYLGEVVQVILMPACLRCQGACVKADRAHLGVYDSPGPLRDLVSLKNASGHSPGISPGDPVRSEDQLAGPPIDIKTAPCSGTRDHPRRARSSSAAPS